MTRGKQIRALDLEQQQPQQTSSMTVRNPSAWVRDTLYTNSVAACTEFTFEKRGYFLF